MKYNFCAFIISHGRPNKVRTYDALNKFGYTGPKYIVIDNLDKKSEDYYSKYGDEILMFDKPEIAKKVDNGDNFNNLRTTTHARNACFELAKHLGYEFFIVLDDDYGSFRYRFINDTWITNSIAPNGYSVNDLDGLFEVLLNFYTSINVKSISMAQGGDFIGGEGCGMIQSYFNLSRKCMNSFICSINRPFNFFSRLNEDVNTYLDLGSKGDLFLTIPFTGLEQEQTQKTGGGMTDAYLDGGTFVKSFYTVMYCPSFCKVSLMGVSKKRLHHSINWENAVPRIIEEKYKK